MLYSLNIRNYRNLKELKLNSLGKVNLIIGKNNTGKSSILEAIAIYATKGDINLINQLLGERGENYKLIKSKKSDSIIKSLSSLFTNRIIGYSQNDNIYIGEIQKSTTKKNSITLGFVLFHEEIVRNSNGNIVSKERTYLLPNRDDETGGFKIGFEIKDGEKSSLISLEDDEILKIQSRNFSFNSNNKLQFIRTRNVDKDLNAQLFDAITLTDKEQFVIDALRIIEKSTERIAFVEDYSDERTAVIKLAGNQNILPLKSMGDGINRILTIILALVNCEGGFLLIDEFENGLHYSVQEQLWKIVFSLSEKLNIQVFVTTHSEDCINGFENTLNSLGNKLEGKLIRLNNLNGKITQVEYDASELKIATDLNIETR